MRDEQRAAEIKAEIERLKDELRAVQGYCQLSIKNKTLVTYPMVTGDIDPFMAKVEQRYLDLSKIALSIRLVLTPEYRKKDEKAKFKHVYPKPIKNLSEKEYRAVCDCLDEVAEVIDRHNQNLHPNGIAYGHYVEGQELYR